MRGNGLARRIALSVLGGALILLGLVLMVLPGPGLILVLGGVVLLAKEYPWAQRLYEPVQKRAMQAAEASVATPLRIVWSVAVGFVLIGLGVAWIVFTRLPFGDVSTGSSLILSGVLLLALLLYSYRRVRRPSASSTLL